MAETDNLKLYKADPVADSDKTFNIDTMLNGNWDKIDSKAAEWDGKETPEGAQAKADDALAAAKVYADEKVADIDLSNITPESIGAAKQADLDAHATDAVKHITAAERATWNAKETTEGAQAKANQAEANAKNASLPRSGGTITGGLAVNGAFTVQSRDVIAELDSVKKSVVSGKGVVAEAINGKGGGPVSASNTFPEMAAAITGIRQATGSLNLTAGFLDNYRVGQTSTPQVNDGKTFINANNNFLFIAFTYDMTYQPILREVTPSGTVVKTTLLGGPVLRLQTFGVGWGLVGEGVAVFSSSDAHGEYIHAYTHNGTRISTTTRTNTYGIRDVCRDGSNIFTIGGSSPITINNITGTKYFEVPGSISAYGLSQFLSSTKAFIAIYASEELCRISMVTRDGTSFSNEARDVLIPYRKVYSLLASYAYR